MTVLTPPTGLAALVLVAGSFGVNTFLTMKVRSTLSVGRIRLCSGVSA